MPKILHKLEGGDRRSIGRANEVVSEVIANPMLFAQVIAGLRSADAIVRARAADAVEKITRRNPKLLFPYKRNLIGPLAHLDQKEVRWHVAQMLPRVPWSKTEQQRVMDILTEYLNDPSSIVKTFAMQGLADCARRIPALRQTVLSQLQDLTATGTPAMKARGRKLQKELGDLDGKRP